MGRLLGGVAGIGEKAVDGRQSFREKAATTEITLTWIMPSSACRSVSREKSPKTPAPALLTRNSTSTPTRCTAWNSLGGPSGFERSTDTTSAWAPFHAQGLGCAIQSVLMAGGNDHPWRSKGQFQIRSRWRRRSQEQSAKGAAMVHSPGAVSLRWTPTICSYQVFHVEHESHP